MIEDSDDGEEIIEYKPDEPELRYKRECDAEVNYQHFMRAWCMTWARRKKVCYSWSNVGQVTHIAGFHVRKLACRMSVVLLWCCSCLK